MKLIYLCLILIIGIYGLTSNIVPMTYINYYTFIVIVPLVIIVLKKNLLKALFVLFLLLIFQGVPWIRLQGLPDISPYRVLLLMIVFIIIFELIIGQRKSIGGIVGIKTAMVLFCLYTLLSMVPTGLIFREGQGSFLTNYVIPFTIFFVTRALMTSEKDIKKMYIFLSILGFYLGFTGICEYFKLDFLIFPSYIADPKRGIHYGMARGPFVESSQNGVVLGILLFISIHTLMYSNKKTLRVFFGITIPLIIAALVFTFNRASWFGVLFASVVFSIYYTQIRKYLIIIFLLLIIVVSAFQMDIIELPTKKDYASTSTLEGRLVQYDAAWNMFLDKPFFGYGFRNHINYLVKYYRYIKGLPGLTLKHHQYRQATIHNVLFNMLLQVGLIGTSIYIYIICSIFAMSLKLYKMLPNNEFIGKGIVISYWGMSSTFFMKYMFTDWWAEVFPIILFFAISGIIVGLYQKTAMEVKMESSTVNGHNQINVPA